MSTQYPILDNRPINKWKVTELRDELKRRNLKINGLKDDLVKRLDEAIRNELEIPYAQKEKDLDQESEPVDSCSIVNEVVAAQPASTMGADENNKNEENEIVKSSQNDAALVVEPRNIEVSTESSAIVNVAVDNLITSSEQRPDESDITMDNEETKSSDKRTLENSRVEKGAEVLKSGKKDDVLVEESRMTESVKNIGTFPEVLSNQIMPSDRTLEDSSTKVDNDDIGVRSVASGEKPPGNQEVKVESEAFKPLQMDAECDVSYPSNQVHEVNTNLEIQVKSKSISTDTLSFYEQKELKDNLNADNVQLEAEVIRPGLVLLSSSKNLPRDGIFHPLDDRMPRGNQGFVGDTDDEKSRNMEVTQKNGNAEIKPSDKVGVDNKLTDVAITKYSSPEHADEPEIMEASAEEKFAFADSAKEANSQGKILPDFDFGEMAKVADRENLEKINLDQSSADDSMEEDVMEAKHIGSNETSAEISKKAEPMDESGTGESGSIDDMHTAIPTDKLEPFYENKDKIASDVPSDKLEPCHENKDKIASLSAKRMVQEAEEREPPKRQRRWNSASVKVPGQQNSDASVSTPKNLFQAVPEKANIAAFDGDAPKERIVPPSAKTPTNSLRIDNFLRPFTLKAVQELLAKTGKVCSFWMDHIKTHCYVMYSTVEETIETRNAVYNLQWPTNVGRLLIADFVDPQEVKQQIEAPPQSHAPPVSMSPSVVPTQTPSQLLQPFSQQGPNQLSDRRHPLSRELPAFKLHEKLPRAPLPVPDKIGPPIGTLDDLFRKTKATPRIYYLPLSEEQVAAKVQKKGKH